MKLKTVLTVIAGLPLVMAPIGKLKAEGAEIPPLAQVHYDGEKSQLKYESLLVVLDSETTHDGNECAASADNGDVSCTVLTLKGVIDGQQVFVMHGPTFEKNEVQVLNASVEIRRLDPATSLPQVVLSYYSMGAHCCTTDRIMTIGPFDKWSEIVVAPDSEDKDGFSSGTDGNYKFLDLDHDGGSELVTEDSHFAYQFSSYAGSYAPTRIWKLSGGILKSVEKSSAYQAFSLRKLREMEDSRGKAISSGYHGISDTNEINGYLAGWVAQSSLAGRLKIAWKVMMSSYDHNAADGREVCRINPPATETCPSDQSYMVPFPQALAVFLSKLGYLSAEAAKNLGYDLKQIVADQATSAQAATPVYEQQQAEQKKSGWYAYLNDGSCVEARNPPSPMYLINFDRLNGLADDVVVLKSDSNGKALLVRIGEPLGNGLDSIYTFARGLAECEAYSRQKKQSDNNLN